MKKIKNKEYIMFGTTVILLLMCGIALNNDLTTNNKEQYSPTQVIKIEVQEKELFSPEPVLSLWPILLGILIIVLTTMLKEGIITMKKIKIFMFYLESKRDILFRILKQKYKLYSKNVRKIYKKRRTIDVTKIMKDLKSIRLNKKAKGHYIKIKRGFISELKKVNDLFTKPYKKEDLHKYISIVLIVAAVGMGMIAANPNINPGFYAQTETKPSIIVEPISLSFENLSPGMQIDFWPIILGLMIITTAVILKEKKDGAIK